MAICPLMSKPDQNGKLQIVECSIKTPCAWFNFKTGSSSPCLLIQQLEDIRRSLDVRPR